MDAPRHQPDHHAALLSFEDAETEKLIQAHTGLVGRTHRGHAGQAIVVAEGLRDRAVVAVRTDDP